MENQNVVDRIIETTLQSSENKEKNKITLEDFLKCISVLSSTNFEDKISLFFKVSSV